MIPINDKVIVTEIEEKEDEGLSIVLPDSIKSPIEKGRVHSVGRGRPGLNDTTRQGLTVQPGDIVLYQPEHARKFELDGKEMKMLIEDYIIAIVNR